MNVDWEGFQPVHISLVWLDDSLFVWTIIILLLILEVNFSCAKTSSCNYKYKIAKVYLFEIEDCSESKIQNSIHALRKIKPT